jgi:hypothetical protein
VIFLRCGCTRTHAIRQQFVISILVYIRESLSHRSTYDEAYAQSTYMQGLQCTMQCLIHLVHSMYSHIMHLSTIANVMRVRVGARHFDFFANLETVFL